MATKVTDFIPQSSWISKWFNPLQNNEDALESRENIEETEDDTQQPPNKRSRICMDTIHPPGTFSIQTRTKSALNTIEPSKEQYPVHNEVIIEYVITKYLESKRDIFCLLQFIYRGKIFRNLQQLDQVE